MIRRLGALGLLWATADAEPARWEQLSPLPAARGVAAPFAGTIGGRHLGTTIQVGIGSEAPGAKAATNRGFALDLAPHPFVWRELLPLPDKPRLFATTAAHQGRWLIIGGAALQPHHSGDSKREYLRDVWTFLPP